MVRIIRWNKIRSVCRRVEVVQARLLSLSICSLLLLPHPHRCKHIYSRVCIYEVSYLMPIIESLAGEMHIFWGPSIWRTISNLIRIQTGKETLDQISKVPPWLCLISMEIYVFCTVFATPPLLTPEDTLSERQSASAQNQMWRFILILKRHREENSQCENLHCWVKEINNLQK